MATSCTVGLGCANLYDTWFQLGLVVLVIIGIMILANWLVWRRIQRYLTQPKQRRIYFVVMFLLLLLPSIVAGGWLTDVMLKTSALEYLRDRLPVNTSRCTGCTNT
ncbi:MAG: hypothetical protein HY565_04940 [Candidatus Kerfeldbacteria bacterium]|nr:hypothetical protein [Candidatus Kerfeldbacteria bacterium]